MKKTFLLLLALFLCFLSVGCSTIGKFFGDEEAQAAIAADIQKLAGTDKLAARFDAAEERANLAYAFTWLTAEKAGITETDARDWLAGKTGGDGEEAEEEEEAPEDVDAIDYSLLQWKFGGVDGSRAKLDSPRLYGLSVNGGTLRWHWDTGLDGWGLARAQADALACLFVTRSDGSLVGGKFEWTSTSRSSRSLGTVLGGYGGWSLDGVPATTKVFLVILDKEGRKRSNVVSAEWSR